MQSRKQRSPASDNNIANQSGAHINIALLQALVDDFNESNKGVSIYGRSEFGGRKETLGDPESFQVEVAIVAGGEFKVSRRAEGQIGSIKGGL